MRMNRDMPEPAVVLQTKSIEQELAMLFFLILLRVCHHHKWPRPKSALTLLGEDVDTRVLQGLLNYCRNTWRV